MNDLFVDVRVVDNRKELLVQLFISPANKKKVDLRVVKESSLGLKGSLNRQTVNPLLLKLMVLIDMGEEWVWDSGGKVKKIDGVGSRYTREDVVTYYMSNVRVSDLQNAHNSDTIEHITFEG